MNNAKPRFFPNTAEGDGETHSYLENDPAASSASVSEIGRIAARWLIVLGHGNQAYICLRRLFDPAANAEFAAAANQFPMSIFGAMRTMSARGIKLHGFQNRRLCRPKPHAIRLLQQEALSTCTRSPTPRAAAVCIPELFGVAVAVSVSRIKDNLGRPRTGLQRNQGFCPEENASQNQANFHLDGCPSQLDIADLAIWSY